MECENTFDSGFRAFPILIWDIMIVQDIYLSHRDKKAGIIPGFDFVLAGRLRFERRTPVLETGILPVETTDP
jgi:hypothetical protein